MKAAPGHVLSYLEIPARYEQLSRRLGPDVVKLLTPPDSNIDALRRVAAVAGQTGEGLLVPCFGETGTGKTTLAQNVSFFLPSLFTPTVNYGGEISASDIGKSVMRYIKAAPPVRGQLVAVNIDHREGAPPSEEELAGIKRFLRTSDTPCVVLWLETDRERAQSISDRYSAITGRTIVELPLVVTGPARETWQDIAANTVELCNPVPGKQVVELGIDPRSYDPGRFPSIGEFLKQVAIDFAKLVLEHQASTKRPITLVLAFVSEALDRGVLPSLTHGSEPGLLDSHALLKSTPDSMIGKRWAAKRGILTQTILRLDARAFWFPPAAAVAILHRYGPDDVKAVLGGLKRTAPSPIDVAAYISRTDVGRYLLGDTSSAYETRGRPAEDAKAALGKIAEQVGFGRGNDKRMNHAFAEALSAFLKSRDLPLQAAVAETALAFCNQLIPDNQFDLGERLLCMEYIWRSGDALDSSRRSEAAQYALEKLHAYAVNLGWTTA